jgi:gluconolactonase
MPTNPLKGWRIDPKDIKYAGHDLQRPECILAERDGTLWSADARGGVMQIRPDGSQTLIALAVRRRDVRQTRHAASGAAGWLAH